MRWSKKMCMMMMPLWMIQDQDKRPAAVPWTKEVPESVLVIVPC
jgi:hypothetical protein